MLATDPALALHGVSVSFRGTVALADVHLEIHPGEVMLVRGPNGSGKTTLVNAIMGTVAARGQIEVHGRSVDGLPTWARARHGLARSFQARRVFPRLGPEESRSLGDRSRQLDPSLSVLARMRSIPAALTRVTVAEAGALPAPSAENADICALLRPPVRCALLDEPMAGRNEAERRSLVVAMEEFLGTGGALVVIDHVLDELRCLAHWEVVLSNGRIAQIERLRMPETEVVDAPA